MSDMVKEPTENDIREFLARCRNQPKDKIYGILRLWFGPQVMCADVEDYTMDELVKIMERELKACLEECVEDAVDIMGEVDG
jgi:hypothetical protein